MRLHGTAIRIIRERSGLSLADLARATEIDASTLSRIETGQRPGTTKQLVMIARALNVPHSAIIDADTAVA